MDAKECTAHRLVADVCVIAGERVLLVRYKDVSRYDNQRGWFLPDDYLAHLEHPEDAAKRILQEQTGIPPTSLTKVADPATNGGRGEEGIRLNQIESFGNGTWHLIFHYKLKLAQAPTLVPGQNIAAAEWFALNALPDAAEVAHHGWALDVIRKIVE